MKNAAAPQRRHVVLAGRMVEYDLVRARRRSIGMDVDLDGLTVRAPRWVALRDVEQARNATSLDEAARTLGANLVVEGTVQAAGDNLRLIVNLHDIDGMRQIWSRQFTGTRDALFSLQDGIYDGIVSALSLSPRADSLAHSSDRPTDNIEAYDLYLKGRDALRSGQDPEQLKQSIDFFEQAIKQDGIWKIDGMDLDYTVLADYAAGWTAVDPAASRRFAPPADQLARFRIDAPLRGQVFAPYPRVAPMGFHFANPVSGREPPLRLTWSDGHREEN